MTPAPRLLFFSGGSGPGDLARIMARASIPSVHIVSTFDSGRSSKELRRAFGIPAVGDLRNRLLALANLETASPQVLDFLSFRLPPSGDAEVLRKKLLDLQNPNALVWRNLPDSAAKLLYKGLEFILTRIPESFNPLNAQLGNLFLAGEYLRAGRHFGPALATFSRLVDARGIVLPICSENLNIGAELQNGEKIVGQDKFKELFQNIVKLFLTVHEPACGLAPDEIECRPPLYQGVRKFLKDCSLICFPMGSFYSSIVVNTLPKGVGSAISRNPCLKVFIPNSGYDPEASNLDIGDQAGILLSYLRRDAPDAEPGNLLNYVLVDEKNGEYPGGISRKILDKLKALGLETVFCPIVSKNRPNHHNPVLLLNLLLNLAGWENA